jgi:hypothetical protein
MAFYSNALDFPNLTSKTTPVGADILMIADSAAANVPKQITISSLPFAPATGSLVVNVTSATQAMAVETTYFVNYTGGVCTLTLPALAPQGAFINIIGGEAVSNAWVVAQLALQTVRIIDQVTTAGVTGTLTAANKFNSITLTCDDAGGTGLTWSATKTMGSFAGV